MRKPKLTRITAMLLAFVMAFGIFVVMPQNTSAAASSSESSAQEIANILNADSYAEYSARYTKQKKGTEEIAIDIFDFRIDPNTLKANEVYVASENPEMQGVAGADEAVYMPDHGQVSWKLNITEEQRGMYALMFEYYPIVDNVSTIERVLYIDGAVPFSEARSLSFTKLWKYYYDTETTDEAGNPVTERIYDYMTDENGKYVFRQDVNGNDLRYNIEQTPDWRTYYCTDVDGYYFEPFEFYLSAGEHTITLEGVRESLVLKSIKLVPVPNTLTYEEYSALHADAKAAEGEIVRIEAELPYAVSDTSISPTNDRSSSINSPSVPDAQLYNVIGANSYSTVGQWASYKFEVTDTGLYDIVFRYRQNALEGMFVSRVIKLWSSDGMYGLPDGTPTVPFKEANSIRFDFSKEWQATALGEGGNAYQFYFKEGVEYVIQIEVGLGELSDIISTVQNALTSINNSYLNILKLTGASPDKYRDYGFLDIMPETVRALNVDSRTLYAVSEAIVELCGTKGSHVATLDKIAELLNRMGSDEDEIAANLSNLKSNIGTLGTWLNSSKTQSLTLDFVNIQPAGSKLPRAKASAFSSIWFEIRSFVSSFFVDYNSLGVTEENQSDDSIDVWLAYGRDQSLIWRNMIDSQFTPASGVAVNLKLVTATTLLPSVLAGQGPDVYIGLASADVINYAIRGAIKDVQDYEGFEDIFGYDVTKTVYNEDTYTYNYYTKDGKKVDISEINFNYANTIPISLYGKTYGVPETTNFPMMFYRMDVLADVGIDIPKTWDEVLEAVPVLQANNMEIGLTYETATDMILYQFGGSRWRYEDDEEYAGAQIGLDTDTALDAFRFCVRLYTDYSFPVTFDAANRFRTGEMPLVITDYCNTYNTLTVFATEIRGLWKFTSVPGVIRENGEISNCSMAALTATVMLYNDDEQYDAAWEYMKWQSTAEAQASYGNQMVALVGPAAKYASANMNAIKDLSWTSSEYEALISQMDNLAAVPNYPGSYIIARYTKFAFLAAVNEDADPIDELQGYITTINKELTRKREEFELKTLALGQTPEEARAEGK